MNIRHKKLFICGIIIINFTRLVYGQVELVPVGNPVYDFLKRADLQGWINGYNSSALPLSRYRVAQYLIEINEAMLNDKVTNNEKSMLSDSSILIADREKSNKSVANKKKRKSSLTEVDRKMLKDYLMEFGYDIFGDLRNGAGVLNGDKMWDEEKYKFLYMFADSNATLFADAMGWISGRWSEGDSIGKNSVGLGELGLRIRGTVLNSVGFYLRVSNGQKLWGEDKDVDFARITNPKWRANHKMKDRSGNFDIFEGYVRYAVKDEIVALTAGREQVFAGFGYTDKMFLSNNSVPMSFIRFDLNYKKLQYFFMYGSLRGDSLGKEIEAKYLATHRVNLNLFDQWRIGFFEALTITDRPFNFSFLNPFSFIRSADYSAGDEQSSLNNAIIGLDMEVKPFKKLAWQGTMLIDDLDFGTLFSGKTEYGARANGNRFGWQTGVIWTDAFWVKNLTAAIEYARLNPFVYTHRTNKAQYTHWTLPLGLQLQPNSDEIAVKFNYDLTNRLNVQLLYRHQRHAEGFLFSGDTLKINYGGNISRGDKDIVIDNTFLQGNRIDRDVVTASIVWQPVRQLFVEGNVVLDYNDLIYSRRKLRDVYGWVTARVEI